MATKNPVHSGTVVREDCLNYLDLSVTERAKRLWRWVPDAFQPSERKGRRFHRNSLPAVESFWLDFGNLVRHADGLRARPIA